MPLRKDAYDALVAASLANSEAQARKIISAINEKIRRANRNTIEGPSLMLVPYDVGSASSGSGESSIPSTASRNSAGPRGARFTEQLRPVRDAVPRNTLWSAGLLSGGEFECG